MEDLAIRLEHACPSYVIRKRTLGKLRRTDLQLQSSLVVPERAQYSVLQHDEANTWQLLCLLVQQWGHVSFQGSQQVLQAAQPALRQRLALC